MTNASIVIETVKQQLKTALIDSWEFEAIELVCHFAKINRTQLLIDPLLTEVQIRIINDALAKRVTGYPLQYILGEWEFYGITLKVGEGVLIPRADTESLVEICINFVGKRKLKIVDLCSGSGCIAIALKKHLPQCEIYAIEKSQQALHYLKENVRKLGLNINIIEGDVLDNLALRDIDLIVSNPPYLTKTDMDTLQIEVTHEPTMALYGEDDGLFFYRNITSLWKDKLNDNAMIAYEIGQGQHNEVKEFLINNGYRDVCEHKDLCDIVRVITALK